MQYNSELKESLKVNGELIIKSIEGITSVVGLRKMMIIMEMEKQGYRLVGETTERGYIKDNNFGCSSIIKSEMTFQKK